MRRNKKGYRGTQKTSHTLKNLLPDVLKTIYSKYNVRPDVVLASWPDILGKDLAPMTEAESFVDGVLTVRVKNHTLYSLLSGPEKAKLLGTLRKQFPKITINNIHFRIG